jgi:hypothetical protein
MAQDFQAAFALGESNTSIATVDADGVALAAIQGLYDLVQEQKERIASQQKRIVKLEAERTAQQRQNAEVRARLAALEQLLPALIEDRSSNGQSFQHNGTVE